MQNQPSSQEEPQFTTTISLQLLESIDDKMSNQENSSIKTEELSSDRIVEARNTHQESKQVDQRQQMQSVTKISRLNSTRKEEIKNLGYRDHQKRYKRSKQTEELQEEIRYLRQQIFNLEESSQHQGKQLKKQLKQKQEIIKQKQIKLRQYQKLLFDDLKVLKDNSEQITQKIISDLQEACSAKKKIEIQNKVRLERDYIRKEEYQRQSAQKITLEAQLRSVKSELQQIRKENHHAAQVQKSYVRLPAEFQQLQQENNEKQQIIFKLKKELGQKQFSCSYLKEQLQSLQYSSNQQYELIQKLSQEVPNLKALNSQLHQKCVSILSQSKDAIFLQFNQEIKAFSQQLDKLNEENKYLKQQIIATKLKELEEQKDEMKKDIELFYAHERIKLLQEDIKNRQAQQAATKTEIERMIELKDKQLQAKQNDVRYLEQIIQDNSLFYDTLLASKQLEWDMIGQRNENKAQKLDLVIKIRSQEKKELVNEVKSLKDLHERQKSSMKQAHKQELARSENETMELGIEFEQVKQKFELICKQKTKLQAEHSLMINLIRLIESNDEDLHNLITEIEKINQDHIFDKIAAVFLSLKDKIQKYERKIVSQSQALKKMESSMEDRKVQLQSSQESQEQKYAQLLERQAEINAKYQSLLNQNSEITNQLKQREGTIQRLQEQLKKKIANDGIVQHVPSKNRQFQLQFEKKDRQIARLLAQMSELKDTLNKYNQEKIMLQDENCNLSNKISQLSKQMEKGAKYSFSSKSESPQDRQLQILKKQYEQLQEDLSEANKLNKMISQMEETHRGIIEDLEQEVVRLNQRLKRPSTVTQPHLAQRQRPTIDNTLIFFTLKSVIETSKGGKQFVVKSVEDYCSREVKGIQMVFRKDENNNNTFHSSFKPADLAENICLFLLRKSGNIFGITTFPEVFKGNPSAFLISVTNKRCVYKSQQRNEKAFLYDLNTITFGKNEIRIKSGFKNMTISDVVFRGYFESYVKGDIFGPQFKEVSEIDNFEIHKIYV